MKKSLLLDVIVGALSALALAAFINGCGASNNTTPAPGSPGVVGSSIVAPGYGAPLGNYYYNNGYYSCPYGMIQSANGTCVSNGTLNCNNGFAAASWGTCAPQNFNCMSGAWNWEEGGCLTTTPFTSAAWDCSTRRRERYLCRFVQGAPSTGMAFNGWGWSAY